MPSSGGRKPHLIEFCYDAYHAVGVEIRKHHADICVIDLHGRATARKAYHILFENNDTYWKQINELIHETMEINKDVKNILGVYWFLRLDLFLSLTGRLIVFVFVVNCGSSSIKYQLINMEGEHVMAKGLIERIGLEGSTLKHPPAGKYTIDLKEEIPDHKVGIRLAIKALTSREYGVI